MKTTLVALLLLAQAACVWALGDVQVSVADAKLSILGDANPNAIQIVPGIGTGAFVVVGLDGTAVNGGPSAAVTDVRKVKVEMKEGQDRVEVLQVEIEESLVVKLGSDQDTFLLEGGRVKGKAEVKGGKDGDQLTVRGGARVGGEPILTTGKKADTITVTNVSVGGFLHIGPGNGDDQITVQFSTLDPGAEALLESGDGNDRVDLFGVDFGGDLELTLGNGNDRLVVSDCDFDGEIFVDGDAGHDELDLEGDNTYDLSERRTVRNFEDVD